MTEYPAVVEFVPPVSSRKYRPHSALNALKTKGAKVDSIEYEPDMNDLFIFVAEPSKSKFVGKWVAKDQYRLAIGDTEKEAFDNWMNGKFEINKLLVKQRPKTEKDKAYYRSIKDRDSLKYYNLTVKEHADHFANEHNIELTIKDTSK